MKLIFRNLNFEEGFLSVIFSDHLEHVNTPNFF